MAEAELARFIDRYTMEYVRTYPHPIERVWRAIVESTEFGVWFIKGRLDPRVGGRFWFGDDGFQGAVQTIEPPRLLRLIDDAAGKLFEYELSEVAGGTRLRFVERFPKGAQATPDWLAQVDPQRLYETGGDQPGGPDAPWRPGGCGGFHGMFDQLGDFLDGAPLGSRLPPTALSELVRRWANIAPGMVDYTEEQKAQRARVARSLRSRERWEELIGLYREHIKATIPPAEDD